MFELFETIPNRELFTALQPPEADGGAHSIDKPTVIRLMRSLAWIETVFVEYLPPIRHIGNLRRIGEALGALYGSNIFSRLRGISIQADEIRYLLLATNDNDPDGSRLTLYQLFISLLPQPSIDICLHYPIYDHDSVYFINRCLENDLNVAFHHWALGLRGKLRQIVCHDMTFQRVPILTCGDLRIFYSSSSIARSLQPGDLDNLEGDVDQLDWRQTQLVKAIGNSLESLGSPDKNQARVSLPQWTIVNLLEGVTTGGLLSNEESRAQIHDALKREIDRVYAAPRWSSMPSSAKEIKERIRFLTTGEAAREPACPVCGCELPLILSRFSSELMLACSGH